jgi:hypothetical protein
MVSTAYCNAEAALLLIKSGADPSLRDNESHGVMFHALRYGCEDVIKALLATGEYQDLEENPREILENVVLTMNSKSLTLMGASTIIKDIRLELKDVVVQLSVHSGKLGVDFIATLGDAGKKAIYLMITNPREAALSYAISSGLSEYFATHVFVMMILLCDNYVSIEESCKDTPGARVFEMSRRLPMEIKYHLAKSLFSLSSRTVMPSPDQISNAAGLIFLSFFRKKEIKTE